MCPYLGGRGGGQGESAVPWEAQQPLAGASGPGPLCWSCLSKAKQLCRPGGLGWPEGDLVWFPPGPVRLVELAVTKMSLWKEALT